MELSYSLEPFTHECTFVGPGGLTSSHSKNAVESSVATVCIAKCSIKCDWLLYNNSNNNGGFRKKTV